MHNYVCDKCKKVKTKQYICTIKVPELSEDGIHLCDDCYNDFREWIKSFVTNSQTESKDKLKLR